MKKRLLSALLTVFTVFSLFGTVLMPAASAANAFTVLGDDAEFKELGTTRVPNMWTFNIAAKNPGTKKVSFWIRVTDVTEPIYLVGTYFGFTTENAVDGVDSFVSHGSGSTNLQNHALYVPEAGDYLITTELKKGNEVAWNWKEANGGFKAFTSFGISAVNAADYDANGAVVDTTAKAALMGIIEGTPDLNRAIPYVAMNGQTVQKTSQNYYKGAVKGFNFNKNEGLYVDKSLSFRQITNDVEAPKLDGYKFLGWAAQDGSPAISLTSNALYAQYEAVSTSFVVSFSTNKAGATDGVMTIKLADADLGINTGFVNVSYNKYNVTIPADTDNDGGVRVDFDSVAADGTVATIPYSLVAGQTVDSSFTVRGECWANGVWVLVNDSTTVLNIGAFCDSGAKELYNTVDGNLDNGEQVLWNGEVKLNNELGATLVYKIDGITTPVNLGNFSVNYDRNMAGSSVNTGRESAEDDYWWQNAKVGELVISENGYYFFHMNKAVFGCESLTKINSVKAFTAVPAASYANRANDNADATFELLAIYADNMQVNVNFHNADGSLYAAVPYAYTNVSGAIGGSVAVTKGKLVGPAAILTSAGLSAPVKAGSADGTVTYVLDKWVDAEGNAVDNIYDDIDLYPVYTVVANGATTEYNVHFSTNGAGENGELAVKVADLDKSISAGTVNVTYDTAWFTFADDTDNDGAFSVNYTDVAADGTVAILDYTVAANKVGDTSLTVAGSVTIGSTTATVASEIIDMTIAAYVNQNPQAINKNTVGENGETVLPEEQILWNGKIALGEATGMTLVYKIEGVETPMNLYNFGIGYTCIDDITGNELPKNNSATWDYWWQNTHATRLTISEDGYYFIHIDKSIAGEESYLSFDSFRIFTEVNNGENLEVVEELKQDYANRSNENENATFQLLAVYRQDMVVRVTYHDINGNPIATIPYAYTNIEYELPGNAGLRAGELITPDEIFRSSGVAAPIKPHDDTYFYLINHWVDAEGNRVEGVYEDMDVYPVYERVKRGTAVTYDSASIRTGDPAGMRFTSNVSVQDWYGIAEFGTAIFVGGTMLDAETTLHVPARVDINGDRFLSDYTVDENGIYSFVPGIIVDDTSITYTGVLSNIKASNFSRDFTAMAYFKTMDGEFIYVDSGCTRNANGVANDALSDDSADYADAVREYLQNYIAG